MRYSRRNSAGVVELPYGSENRLPYGSENTKQPRTYKLTALTPQVHDGKSLKCDGDVRTVGRACVTGSLVHARFSKRPPPYRIIHLTLVKLPPKICVTKADKDMRGRLLSQQPLVRTMQLPAYPSRGTLYPRGRQTHALRGSKPSGKLTALYFRDILVFNGKQTEL